MVVTVIAILALLILPLFRDRVEAARRAAAQDELKSLLTAELLVYADTNYFFRLQDLDNSTQYNQIPVQPHEEIPIAQWNRPFSIEERDKLVAGSNRWKGPYISMSRFKFLELRDIFVGGPLEDFFWSAPGQGGPIMDILSPNGADWWPSPDVPIAGVTDHGEDRIPIDPWGTPYLFFGPGRMNEVEGNYQESDFGSGAIFSLGPDGMPGLGVPYQGNPVNLMREMGHVGRGDDYAVYM